MLVGTALGELVSSSAAAVILLLMCNTNLTVTAFVRGCRKDRMTQSIICYSPLFFLLRFLVMLG